MTGLASAASPRMTESEDALTQSSLKQPSEFEEYLGSSTYDYYFGSSEIVPEFGYSSGGGYPSITFSELNPGLPFTSDLSQGHEASCSSSLDSLFALQMTPQNYTTPNTDTVAHHSPTSDGFSTTLTQAPSLASIPLLPTSPVRRKRESSSVSSTSTVDGGGRISKPKQRLIKNQPNGGKAPTIPSQQALRNLIDASGTGVYHGHIASAEAAAADHAELVHMFRKPPKLCTSLSSDATFPAHDTDRQKYVHDMYNAIWDWSDYVEMDKTLGSASMRALQDTDMPSRAEQQKKVLSKPLNDYVVEQLCWRLLKFAQDAQQGIPTVDHWSGADGAWESYATFGDRVAAIGDSLRSSKQLVKSLLTAGDRWCARIANNPKGEYTHKVNNMKVNRRKNERLREATSARRKKEEER